MADLSQLRLTVTSTYAVNADGSKGELLEETEPRYSVPGVAYSSSVEALASVGAAEEAEAEAPADEEAASDEGETLEASPEADESATEDETEETQE